MSKRAGRWRDGVARVLWRVLGVGTLMMGCNPVGCAPTGGESEGVVFNNTTDRTNSGATYLGAAACSACHPDVAAEHGLHGHAHMLNRVEGEAPRYPAEATYAGVPSPPAGTPWTDVAYVIGGFAKKAYFVDVDGYLMATGSLHAPTGWNLDFPPNGTSHGFVDYLPDAAQNEPYEYDCFRCHATGANPATIDNPQYQDNRPGIRGTWAEPGVMCEACHGPGSHHVPNPQARNIFVGSSVRECGRCHARDEDPNVIHAADGYILPYSQWSELRASGGHRDFACVFCHDPHASALYGNGIRNECVDCHSEMAGEDTLAAEHVGIAYTRGSYTEIIDCPSCHMPLATKTASSAGPDVAGVAARIGDTRTHIFRINPNNVSYREMFTADGGAVVQDEQGRAAVTLDYVCLRCHNGVDGGAFELSVQTASDIAPNMHEPIPLP